MFDRRGRRYARTVRRGASRADRQRARGSLIPRAALFLALVGLVAGCALTRLEPGDEAATSTTTAKRATRPAPKRVKVYVVAVDGDTGKRVKTAVARIGRLKDRANHKGLSTLRVRRLAPLPVRVEAPGYLARTVRVPFQRHRQNTVRVYRKALQWPMYGVTPQRTQAQTRIRVRPPSRKASPTSPTSVATSRRSRCAAGRSYGAAARTR